MDLDLFLQWVDGLWILIALLFVRRGQRIISVVFILSCMFLLRLQVEMLAGMGWGYGLFKLIPYDIFTRGFAAYSLVYLFYIALHRLFFATRGAILMVNAISFLFFGLFLSTFIMLL